MGLVESSFVVFFFGEIMVMMMRRGLVYEGKKNVFNYVGYEEVMKKWF